MMSVALFVCGWACGVATTLMWSFMHEGRQSVVPEQLPQSVPLPLPSVPVEPVTVSMFAPKPQSSPNTERIQAIIDAGKRERIHRWVS